MSGASMDTPDFLVQSTSHPEAFWRQPIKSNFSAGGTAGAKATVAVAGPRDIRHPTDMNDVIAIMAIETIKDFIMDSLQKILPSHYRQTPGNPTTSY